MGKRQMNGLKISFAVVAFVLVQGIGVIWYISKLDSKVDQMYKGFEEENRKEVIENQVKMKLDLENIIADVGELRKVIKKLKNKDADIQKVNKKIKRFFLLLVTTRTTCSFRAQKKKRLAGFCHL